MRKALFQIHLWTGLSLGLYLLAVGVSGSILVFHDELDRAVHHNLHFVPDKASGPQLPIAAIRKAGKAQYQHHTLSAVYVPHSERDTFLLYFKERESERVTHAYFHPVTGRFLGDTHPARSFLRWLQDFHFNLLNGKTGRAVTGVGGLFLVLLAISGVVIWWPGLAKWKRHLRIDPRTSWRRINWDLHGAAGMWTLILLAVWGLTGAYFGFSAPIRSALNQLAPLSFVEAPGARPLPPNAPKPAAKVKVEELIERAQAGSPGATFTGFQLPSGKRATWLIYMSREAPGDNQTTDYYYFDPNSGELIKKWQRGISRSWTDTLVQYIVPIHFGTIGGLATKLLWSAAGLALPMLFLTGSLMWWNRLGRRKWASLSAARPSRTVTTA